MVFSWWVNFSFISADVSYPIKRLMSFSFSNPFTLFFSFHVGWKIPLGLQLLVPSSRAQWGGTARVLPRTVGRGRRVERGKQHRTNEKHLYTCTGLCYPLTNFNNEHSKIRYLISLKSSSFAPMGLTKWTIESWESCLNVMGRVRIVMAVKKKLQWRRYNAFLIYYTMRQDIALFCFVRFIIREV